MVDDIKVIAEREFSFIFEDARISMTKGAFGKSFNVLLGNRVAGSCS